MVSVKERIRGFMGQIPLGLWVVQAFGWKLHRPTSYVHIDAQTELWARYAAGQTTMGDASGLSDVQAVSCSGDGKGPLFLAEAARHDA